MSCFNNDIAIGVTTDFERVDLESRFQMWGMYLWLSNYRVFMRMLCPKQGDENELNLPISYHPYYTQQTFQVGKRKLDIVFSLGKNLIAKQIEGIRESGTILKDGAPVVAYGLEEESQEETVGRLRKKNIVRDAGCYDKVIPADNSGMERFAAFLQEDTIPLINPFLLAEAPHYAAAAEAQTLTEKPYIMLYASRIEKEVYGKLVQLASELEWDLLVNDKLAADGKGIVYSEKNLDRFYGVLMGAKYVVTDSHVVAGLAAERSLPLTILPGADAPMKRLVKMYRLGKCAVAVAEDAAQIKAAKKTTKAAALRMVAQRMQAYRILEDMMGLTRKVDCPTNIRMADCYGCYACKEICPKSAITMERDEEGFYFPHTDSELCINCGLCERICIARDKKQYAADRLQSEEEKQNLPKAYIGTCISDEQLAQSTSGGVFRSLVRYTIEKKNGVVVGTCFDENANVITDFAETMEDALKFSGSKYVRREIDGIFPKVKEYLDAGREVLFSGVPCECAGLRAYLKKDYDNLTQCEILCHGGASPKIYEKYIGHINRKLKAKVKKVNFRDKSKSWLQKDFKLTFEFDNREPFSVRGRRNNYMNAFLMNYIFRISCYRCQYAGNNRAGDITIGDCHGVNKVAKDLYDERGVSVAVASTPKGEQIWKEVQDEFRFTETTVAKAYVKNHIRPSVLTEERAAIMAKLDKTPINDLLEAYNARKRNEKD